MEEARPKDKILKKVRKALINPSESPYLDVNHSSPIYKEPDDSLDIIFAREFSKVNGNFVFCESKEDLKTNLQSLITEKQWSSIFCIDEEIQPLLENASLNFKSEFEDIKEMQVGITECEYLVARLGSILVSSASNSGRGMNVFPPVHIVIADTSQLVYDIKEALSQVQTKYKMGFPSMISLITGPSRTADIEKTLVMGAHGPKEVYVFLTDKNNY